MDPQESKADKFKRLSEPRVAGTLKKIKLIGNLSSSGYEFNIDQVTSIISSLKAAVDEVEKKFQKGLHRQGYNDEGKFNL